MAPLFPPYEASGTSWQPGVTAMQGVHREWGGWSVMLHANVFAQVLYEPGDRHRTGGEANWQASSVNWGMGMARRPAGAGHIGVRAMLSAEPWTVNDCGYLNFLATGESCDGDTIHDRQHPHDLFMELAGDYDRPVRGSLRWQVYGGLAGEPALGPGGFPHRASSLPNPAAPITHHWLDSTHITYGLITSGLYQQRWKAEVSIFNGREPDDNRLDLDLDALDSYSARLSLLPTERVAVQISAAHLEEGEATLIPGQRTDVDRFTASVSYHRGVGARGLWASMVAYGLNSERELIPGGIFDATTHALLLESSYATDGGHNWFGRAELVGKPAHDLHAHEYGAAVFAVGKIQVGYEWTLPHWKGLALAPGGSLSLSLLPPELRPRYSGSVAPGVGMFLRIRPAGHVM